ncbi:glutathione S-transferase T3-like [Salvia splendens]|uniref:glutathione S-transferase T3-like n=1 Tax=Salvia splendens TaxID=180675 RepID=UPI001C2763BE|nr:glutathione S-transferase T3-like [Salvia splendens]
MNDFVNANNWYVPPSPGPNATPSSGLPTNMEITSPVSTDEYEISDIEPAVGRGKGKVADDEGPKNYSPQETLWLAKNFIDVSEDPIIGNQQSGKVFWERIAEKYNAGRPRGSFERSYVKLRKHWSRVQKEMNKWNGKWTNVIRMWPSGHSELDLVEKARAEFFKYFDVWKIVEKSPKYTDDDVFLSSPSTQSRPMGTTMAKRKAKGKATASYSAMPPPLPNQSLDKISDSMSEMSITWRMSQLTELTSRNTSTMSEFDLELHHEMIVYLRTQMKK